MRIRFLVGSLLLCIAASCSAQACPICVGMPKKSDADYLVDAHCVILARENPDAAYSFAPVEVLKGNYDGGEIDLLVDSLTRRRLAADPTRKVVLVQAEPKGSWHRLGIASDTFESVVRRIVVLAPTWTGHSGAQKRLEFFLPLFGHEDHRIYLLAYLELGRAPYDRVREIAPLVTRDQLDPILSRQQYTEWRSLAILLLARSSDPADARLIWNSLRSSQRHQLTTNLAAWATAAIELDGKLAVEFLDQQYCQRQDRTLEELDAIQQALAIHSKREQQELRASIAAAYRSLLNTHPAMLQRVSRDKIHLIGQDQDNDRPLTIESTKFSNDNRFVGPAPSAAGDGVSSNH